MLSLPSSTIPAQNSLMISRPQWVSLFGFVIQAKIVNYIILRSNFTAITIIIRRILFDTPRFLSSFRFLFQLPSRRRLVQTRAWVSRTARSKISSFIVVALVASKSFFISFLLSHLRCSFKTIASSTLVITSSTLPPLVTIVLGLVFGKSQRFDHVCGRVLTERCAGPMPKIDSATARW